MVSKTYPESFCIISDNKIIPGPLVFTGTSFLDNWEDCVVEVAVSGNKLKVISAPGEHNKEFLRTAILDNVADWAQRDYQGHEPVPGQADFVILTEALAKEQYPHLFQVKTSSNKKR